MVLGKCACARTELNTKPQTHHFFLSNEILKRNELNSNTQKSTKSANRREKYKPNTYIECLIVSLSTAPVTHAVCHFWDVLLPNISTYIRINVILFLLLDAFVALFLCFSSSSSPPYTFGIVVALIQSSRSLMPIHTAIF